MIDIGNGKIERLLDKVITFYYEEKEDVKEIFDAGYKSPLCKVMVYLVIALLAWEIGVWAISTRTITVVTDTSVGTVTEYFETRDRYAGEFLTDYEIDYVPDVDIIDIRPTDRIKDGTVIHIKKAINVSIIHDGITEDVTIQGERCFEALNALGITLGENDRIEPALEDEIFDRDQIVIKRVTISYEEEETDKPYKVVYKADPKMTIGKTKVTRKGTTGVNLKTYLVVKEDGVELSRQVVDEKVVSEKKDKVISYGTKILSGVPSDLKYVKKYTHVRAVSYWFSGNPHGAYGLKCEYGTCAVDKKLIPLGSLLYIEGYGYAIANDVGSGVKGKTVDLYMEKLSQCGIWGARWTTVYVVRSGPAK